MSFLYVKVFYGPCTTFGRECYKPQLLNGARDRLRKLGFRVDLVPVPFVNYCKFEMCGHEIFRCNLVNLRFNTDYLDDKVCRKAIEQVLYSAVKFRRALAYVWIWMLLEQEIDRRSEFFPKDTWPTNVKWAPIAQVKECIECCQIAVKKKPN